MCSGNLISSGGLTLRHWKNFYPAIHIKAKPQNHPETRRNNNKMNLGDSSRISQAHASIANN